MQPRINTVSLAAPRQNSNAYVGFPQPDSGLRLAGSYLQNQFRQASAAPDSTKSRSLSVPTGYSQGLHAPTVSKPAWTGYATARLVYGGSVPNPTWNQLGAKNVATPQLSLSTAIASASSVSKFKHDNPTGWPQQGTRRTGQYLPTSASALSPRESGFFTSNSHRFPAANQAPGAAFKQSASYGHSPVGQMTGSLSPRSAHLLGAGGPMPPDGMKTQTSVTVRARRVSSRRGSAPNKHFASRNFPNQHQSQRSSNYKPNGHLGFQQPSSATGFTGRVGTSGQRFAPSKTFKIPPRFGGYAIRRLKEPEQRELSVRQIYTAPPQQQASSKPQVRRVQMDNWQQDRLELTQVSV